MCSRLSFEQLYGRSERVTYEGQLAAGAGCAVRSAMRDWWGGRISMPKEKRDPKTMIEQLAESDQALRSFTINAPATIDLSKPEDRELVELLSYHVAAGSLYEAH